MSDQLEFLLLGKPLIRKKKVSLAQHLPLKGQALLYYLATTGRPSSRSSLAGLLWGDMPEETARANLRLTLSRVRKALDDDLATSRATVDLKPGYGLDITDFFRLVEGDKKPRESIPEAISLYRGDFLDDFDVSDTLEFENWMLGERVRLRQEALDLFYRLSRHAGDAGDFEAGIAAARHLLHLEPWHEEGHRQLMWLLASTGQRSGALAQYEACRTLLQEELGIEPGIETTQLYEAIKQDQFRTQAQAPVRATPSSPPQRHNLPAQLTPFIGRVSELAQLVERLAQPSNRLMTIVGEGGAGKSRLALAAAERVIDAFPDGVWFVPLIGLARARSGENEGEHVEAQIAVAIAAAMDLAFSGPEDPIAQLRQFLRERRCLLILDNFEGLSAGGGLVLDLLASAPGVSVLITSREPLHAQAEYIFRLEGLPVPQSGANVHLEVFDSLLLFAERAERAGGPKSLSGEAKDQAASICRFVGGSPLGIELAAAWTRWLTLPEILESLQANFAEIESLSRDAPERHRSLRAVFEYSWQLLSPEEQLLLAQLSIFRGGFGLTAVTKVAAVAPSILFSLVDKSLVYRSEQGYFYLHDVVRQFAGKKLDEMAVDRSALADRHARYYLAFVGQQAAALNGPAAQNTVRDVQANYDNIIQAWRWASGSVLITELNRALPGLLNYWNGAGLIREAERLFSETLNRLQILEDNEEQHRLRSRLLAALLVERSHVLIDLGQIDEALSDAAGGRALAEKAGEQALVAASLLQKGSALFYRSHFGEAEDAYTSALEQLHDLPEPTLRGAILRGLAAVVWRRGDYDHAQLLADRSREQYRAANDVRGEARTDYLLGIICHYRQSHQEAQSILERALALARDLQDRRLEMGAYATLGQIANYTGQFERALSYFEREEILCRELGNRYQWCVNRSNLGDTKANMGDFSGARACYDEAISLVQDLKARDVESNLLAHRGMLSYQQGAHKAGEQDCRRALDLALQSGARREEAFARLFLAHNLLAQQRLQEAKAMYEASLYAWEEMDDTMRALTARAGLARVALTQDDTPTALQHLTPILAHLETGTLDGANDPIWIFLTAYETLHAAKDRRAQQILDAGRQFLLNRAGQLLTSETRRAFLTNIPSHRTLRALHTAL